MDPLLSAIAGAAIGAGVTYAITIKVMTKKTVSGSGRISEQSRINAGGDVAGRDIKKSK